MNNLAELILFTLVGKILIYLWMSFPLPEWLDNHRIWGKLHQCGICSGVWMLGGIYIIFHIDLLHLLDLPYYPYLSEMISGGIMSFLVQMISTGIKEHFLTVTIS